MLFVTLGYDDPYPSLTLTPRGRHRLDEGVELVHQSLAFRNKIGLNGQWTAQNIFCLNIYALLCKKIGLNGMKAA